MRTSNPGLKKLIAANAAVFALLAAPAAVQVAFDDVDIYSSARAEEGTGPKGGKPEGMGHKGQGGPGNVIGGKGQGQGGPSGDSDAKGPRFMGGENAAKPPPGTRGGAPVWAKDALIYDGKTAELGRLNVARAPANVFDRQLAEALKTLDIDATSLYTTADLAAIVAAIRAEDPSFLRVDSPLQNLALLKCLLEDNAIGANVVTVNNAASFTTLAGLLIGSAADKTIPVEPATVYAITKIIEKKEPVLPFGVTVEQVAAAAEEVRQAVVFAHDN